MDNTCLSHGCTVCNLKCMHVAGVSTRKRKLTLCILTAYIAQSTDVLKGEEGAPIYKQRKTVKFLKLLLFYEHGTWVTFLKKLKSMCFCLSDFLYCCSVLHQSGACSEGGGKCLFFNLPARKHEEMTCLWDSDTSLNHPKSPKTPSFPSAEGKTWALVNRALWIDKHLLSHSCVFCTMAGNTDTSLTSANVFSPRICTLLHSCWSLELPGLLAKFRRTAIPHFQLKILFPLCSIDTLCSWLLE